MTKHTNIPWGPLARKDADPDVSGLPEGVKVIMTEFAKGLKEYQAKNDKRLDELAKKGTTDVVTKDELKRLDDAMDAWQKKLDELSLEARRPVLVDIGGEKRALTAEEKQHTTSFNRHMRKGDVDSFMTKLEEKALSAGSNPDGGYTVPIQMDMMINRLLSEASPIRGIASVMNISTGMYQKPFSLGGATAGWVGEQTARPQTTSPTLARMSFPAHEMYAMPAATQTLLDDSAINVEEWLANEVRTTFAEVEAAAFVNGDGASKPLGFLSTLKVADASWSWERLGYIATGQSTLDANNGDDLIDLVYTLKQGYRANARFVTNRLSLSVVRKIKATDGHYIWQPGLTLGQPSSILGYPVTEAEDMPDIADGNYPIAFGDFREGYLIVDRIGTRVLRDPFTAKPFVLFYTTKRVGGGVQNFEAIKLLKTAAS